MYCTRAPKAAPNTPTIRHITALSESSSTSRPLKFANHHSSPSPWRARAQPFPEKPASARPANKINPPTQGSLQLSLYTRSLADAALPYSGTVKRKKKKRESPRRRERTKKNPTTSFIVIAAAPPPSPAPSPSSSSRLSAAQRTKKG